MAALTIAQLREIQLNKFNNNFIQDLDKAKNLINRYYRLCGMDERLLYLENDERWHNKAYTKNLADKAQRTLDKLKQDLKSYNLTLIYFGYLPTICEIGSTNNAYYAYFYK